MSAEKLQPALARMREAVAAFDTEELARLLRETLPEFRPGNADAEAEREDTGTVVAFPARQARKT